MSSTALGKRKSAQHGSDERTPKRQNVAELYAPTMVTVHISNSSVLEDGEELEEEEFQVPRGLICAYSAYFDSVFNGQFAESNTGRSVIDDVRPWAFRVYVGWLYFQQISYAGGRIEPKNFRTPNHAVEPSYDASLGYTTSSFAADAERHCSTNGATSAALPGGSSDVPCKEVIGSSHRDCILSACRKCEIRTDQNPLTWYWQELFELYVLGEKYDTRNFRMMILEVIQKKRITKTGHLHPKPSALTYLCDNIPAGALILDMVAKMHYEEMTSVSNLSLNIGYFQKLPASILALGLLAAAKRAKALKCKDCSPGKGRHRHSDDHAADDLVGFDQTDECRYHEHGDNFAEKAQCKAVWDAWTTESLDKWADEQNDIDEGATS